MNRFKGKYLSPFLRIITSPVTIAVLVSVALIPFVNTLFPRYKAEITTSGLVEKVGGIINYYDIDGDGRSEQFITFINSQGLPACKVTDQFGKIVDQQEYNGNAFPSRLYQFFRDLDQDEQPEILTFYLQRDSLFLNIIEYQRDYQKQLLEDLFIALVRNPKGKHDFNLTMGPSADLDGDSIHELIFSVMAGYPLVPRNHFIYNLNFKSLRTSGYTGTTGVISHVLQGDSNGEKVLLSAEYAPGNIEDTLIEGVNDQGAYFRVLDSEFNPIFNPIRFEGKYGGTICMPVFVKGKINIAVLYNHRGKPKRNPLLQVYSIQGKLLAQRTLSTGANLVGYNFISLNDRNSILSLKDDEGRVTSFDENLQPIRSRQTELINCSNEELVDMDSDGEYEKVFLYQDYQKIAICREDMSNLIIIDIPHESYYTRMALKKNLEKPDELFLQFSQKYFLVSYYRNPSYPYRFPAYLATFAAILGFVLLIQFLQRVRLREKYRNERNLTALQLKLVKKQVDPHFLFNVITTLSYNVLQKDPEDAYAGISHLARFMRSAVEWGDKIARPLKDELEVVRTYLKLFSNQHPGKFEFSVEISDTVDLEHPVPVMIIQNYVENAVKHGIRSRDGLGRVIVRVTSDLKTLFIEIEDNGIGRKASADTVATGTGKGLSLMQQYLDLLNKYNDKKVFCTIEDLMDSVSQPSGTLVKLMIPLEIRYSVYEK